MAAKIKKVPVTERAIVQRINRKLATENQRLAKSKSHGELSNLGQWYILDMDRNAVVDSQVDPERLAKELGAMGDWEKIEG